jgi:hypothetical protein
MKSSFLEELKNAKTVSELHEKSIEKMSVPEWAKQLNCPFCREKLSLISIRDIGIKLNSRNIGDLYVTVCCEKCRSMDTLYFRNDAKTIQNFCDCLKGINTPKSEPIIEEKMYSMQYNNLIENSIKET